MSNSNKREIIDNLKYWVLDEKEAMSKRVNYPTTLLSKPEIHKLSENLKENIQIYKDHKCFPKLLEFYEYFEKVRRSNTSEKVAYNSELAEDSLKNFTFCLERNNS